MITPASRSSQRTRTPEILAQDRHYFRNFESRQQRNMPAGARSSNQLEFEAARVFRDAEGAAQRVLTGPGKYMEAHALEIELTEVLLKV